ncbi:MAG: hypothetical protein AABZ80_04075 [Gemmatimonadota bacterium]
MSQLSRSLLLSAIVVGNAGAQKVLLELRPRVGDTLRMQLQQVTEMSSSAAGAPITTTLRMFSRAIVESAAPIASLILAVTDSVDVTSSDVNARALGAQAEQELEGRQMRLRLWPDGTVTLNDGAGSVPRDVSDLVSVMPASFPSKPVAVGESWVREMPVPSGESLGIPGGSVMRARFRLDSTAAQGDLAYVTMTGTLVPTAKPAGEAVTGSVSGTMVVNRRRGWLSESHFLLLLKSTVAQKDKANAALRFSVKVTQSMKVLSLPRPQRR